MNKELSDYVERELCLLTGDLTRVASEIQDVLPRFAVQHMAQRADVIYKAVFEDNRLPKIDDPK